MILSIIYHGIYEMMPNFITSIFFPVNESIWEHGKMILMSFLTYSFIENKLFDMKHTITNNYIAAIISMFLTYLIFTPIYLYVLKTNDNMVVTITIYLISVVISQIIKERYIHIDNSKIGLIGFILTFVIYGILTYSPLRLPIFYDYREKIYGIRWCGDYCSVNTRTSRSPCTTTS